MARRMRKTAAPPGGRRMRKRQVCLRALPRGDSVCSEHTGGDTGVENRDNVSTQPNTVQ